MNPPPTPVVYSATLEPLEFVLRVHPSPAAAYGDGYVWSASVQARGDVAFVKGVDRPLTPAMHRAARAALRAAGFRAWAYEQFRDVVQPDGTTVRVVAIKEHEL